MNRTLIAIDPGTTSSAYVVLEENTRALLDHGKIPNETMLDKIRHIDFAKTTSKTRMLIEMISSYGMGVGQEVFETCVWIGKFLEACPSDPSLHHRLQRREVKKLLHLPPSATDSKIRSLMIERHSCPAAPAIGNRFFPGPLYGVVRDEWQALALAHAFLDREAEGDKGGEAGP